MKKSESLRAVHTCNLYKIIEKQIDNIVIKERGLCQYVNRHKLWT